LLLVGELWLFAAQSAACASDRHALARAQLDASRDEGVGDRAVIGERSREPIEFGHDECVAASNGAECLIEEATPSRSRIAFWAARGSVSRH
jgi:hypothetical protein